MDDLESRGKGLNSSWALNVRWFDIEFEFSSLDAERDKSVDLREMPR
jgi:hypothetical protein